MDDSKNMVVEKSWDEFRNSGLLWWINMILHTFGWAIAVDTLIILFRQAWEFPAQFNVVVVRNLNFANYDMRK